MRNLILIATVFLLTSAISLAGEESDEFIRRKIENSHFKAITAFGEPVYCMQTLSQYYTNRSFETAWNPHTTVQLITSIQQAYLEGLNPSDYHLQQLLELTVNQPKTELAKAEHDLLLTDAFLLYTSHLLSGKVNPQTIDAEWHVTRREGDPVELLQQALSTGEVIAAIQTALPNHAVYKNLKGALQAYQRLNAANWTTINNGTMIKKGMEDQRLSTISERLIILGDLKDSNANENIAYDDKLIAAVQQFQARHGLENEGNIGPQTIGALNVSIQERIEQIEANMERWRWLPREFGTYYILVNIANFELDVIKNGELVLTRKVITGKSYRRTPVFSARMQYLVLNPTWTIPPGILNSDILPAVRKDPSYLEKKKLTVLDHEGKIIDPSGVDWNGKAARSYTYRQPPGPDNALGEVKFMFPNKYHVYLHDTPSKELFGKSERALSSGCIRVHEPLSLAEYLLNDPQNWNRQKIAKVVSTQKTQTVQLKEQPNVHLLYWTAWTDTNGIINFRKDIYERDKPLIEQLKVKAPMQK
ncbi:MAG: L,D-transpeptidase family protein [Bacteroidetes bacterium]|nr:L,D-transpeptidase family protein [Bacteroidota bacterium]MBU1579771.1 L,D-transpeptidase family protein [Bacteroidota bacterium]MBU2556771.1 L,D-transpeptidase family protein [Bacteroidota bacterium]